YFLLRNGDNVYRMWTSFEVEDRLVPGVNEFVSFFQTTRWNPATGRDEVVTLKPGSEAFMRAEKLAAERQRHYMRVALILQGLIDRTPIFHPLAEPINVADPSVYGRAIRVILDADGVFSDGR